MRKFLQKISCKTADALNFTYSNLCKIIYTILLFFKPSAQVIKKISTLNHMIKPDDLQNILTDFFPTPINDIITSYFEISFVEKNTNIIQSCVYHTQNIIYMDRLFKVSSCSPFIDVYNKNDLSFIGTIITELSLGHLKEQMIVTITSLYIYIYDNKYNRLFQIKNELNYGNQYKNNTKIIPHYFFTIIDMKCYTSYDNKEKLYILDKFSKNIFLFDVAINKIEKIDINFSENITFSAFSFIKNRLYLLDQKSIKIYVLTLDCTYITTWNLKINIKNKNIKMISDNNLLYIINKDDRTYFIFNEYGDNILTHTLLNFDNINSILVHDKNFYKSCADELIKFEKVIKNT